MHFSVSAQMESVCADDLGHLGGVLALRLRNWPQQWAALLCQMNPAAVKAAGEAEQRQATNYTVKNLSEMFFMFICSGFLRSTKNSASVCSLPRIALNGTEVFFFSAADSISWALLVSFWCISICVFVFSQHLLWDLPSCQPHGFSPDLYLRQSHVLLDTGSSTSQARLQLQRGERGCRGPGSGGDWRGQRQAVQAPAGRPARIQPRGEVRDSWEAAGGA